MASRQEDTERRDSPSFRDILTFKKEIPFGWLISAAVGGMTQLAVLVWMASTVVSDVNSLKVGWTENKASITHLEVLTGALASENQRTMEEHKALGGRLDEHNGRINRLEAHVDIRDLRNR
jgi:hypothetical protein